MKNEKENKIELPSGHTWKETESYAASIVRFECPCGAVFEHDMMDNSTTFEDGEGHQ